MDKVCDTSSIKKKGYYVYKGLSKSKKTLMYIGTTIQIPANRFRWHKSNGKDLVFEIIAICKDANEMIDLEFDLIKEHRPPMNKIVHRKQNLNVALSAEELNKRKGDAEWCQCCLKRRVNKGYKFCYCCGK